MPNRMKPIKMDDGSKIDAFKLLKLIKECQNDLESFGYGEPAYYFGQLHTWLKEDVFGQGLPLEFRSLIMAMLSEYRNCIFINTYKKYYDYCIVCGDRKIIEYDLTENSHQYNYAPTMVIRHSNTYCRIVLNEFSQVWEDETCRGKRVDYRGTIKE